MRLVQRCNAELRPLLRPTQASPTREAFRVGALPLQPEPGSTQVVARAWWRIEPERSVAPVVLHCSGRGPGQLAWRLWHRRVACALFAALTAVGCSESPSEDSAARNPAVTSHAPLQTRIIGLKTELQRDPYSAVARFGLGIALQHQGDPRAAEGELSKALELGMDPNQVVPALARIWLQIGRSKDLIAAHQSTTLADPAAFAELRVALARAHVNLRDPAKARELLAEALAADPKSARALVLQAQMKVADGQVDEALKILDRTLASQPRSIDALEQKGDILMWVRGDAAAATAAYEQAVAYEPWQLGVHAKLISMALDADDVPLAQERLDRLISIAPGALPRLYFDALLARKRGDLPAARDAVQQALSGYPKDLRTLLLAAEIAIAHGALRTAEEHLGIAITVGPTVPKVRHLLAQVYLRSAAPDKAVVILEPLVRPGAQDALALGLVAEAALQHGLHMRAQQLFERAAAIEPANPHYKTALALARIGRGETSAGMSELESAAAMDRTGYADMALLAARMRSADAAGALKAAQQAVAKRPTSAGTLWVLGQLQLQAKAVDEARKTFEKALTIDKSYVPAAMALSDIDLIQNQPARATQRLDDILALSPNNPDALLARADVKRRSGATDAAVTEALKNAVKVNEGLPRPWLALIGHLIRTGDAPAAVLAAQKANGQLPQDMQILDALGRAQTAAGDTAQALTTFKQMSTLRPMAAMPHTRMADVYLARNEIDSAIESMKRAVALQPRFLPAQVKLAGLSTAKKDWPQALKVAKSLQRAQPSSPIGFQLEGSILATQQQWTGAADAFRAALKRRPTAELTTQLFLTLMWQGKRQEADQLARGWINLHPGDSYVHGFLGEYHLLSGDLPRAETHFRAVLERDANNVAALTNVGWLLSQQAKPGAAEFARKAAAIAPSSPEVLSTLAKVLAKDRHFDEALGQIKKAIELAPKAPMLRLELARIALQVRDYPLARMNLDQLSAMGKDFPAQTEVWALRQQLP